MLLLCSRCGKVVILNVFKTSVKPASFLLVFYAVFSVFLVAHWQLQHTVSSGLAESSIAIYTGEPKLACFVYLYHHSRSHFTNLLTRTLFFGPCHCSYYFGQCLAFRVHVSSDLNKTISFIVGVLSTSFPRALLRLIHWSPSCLCD